MKVGTRAGAGLRGPLPRRVAVAGRRLARTPGWPPVVSACLGLVAVVEVVAWSGAAGPPLSTAILLGLVATLPLALVRVQPVGSMVALAAVALLTLVAYQRMTIAGLLAQVAAAYVLGQAGWWWVAGALAVPFAVASALVPAAGAGGAAGAGAVRSPAVLAATLTVAAAAVGAARRARRAAVERDASSRTIADTLLEHAARGERARIARELHDVVAHHISMIAVQSDTARLATPGMPAEGARQLLAIGETARSALTEMRRLLGVLREDAGTEPSRRPQPGLQQLNELIDEARDAAGVSTRLILRGRVAPLGPGVELIAYRIVQEALTNARRHAPGAAVDVELTYRPDNTLRLRVRDNGPGPPVGGGGRDGGHGLLGMRERAATVGGALRAGPAPRGGFLVEVTLPAGRGGAAGHGGHGEAG